MVKLWFDRYKIDVIITVIKTGRQYDHERKTEQEGDPEPT